MPDRAPADHLVSDADARAIIRLLGEVIADPGDYAAKKRLLMNGLCRLIGADYWAWTQLLYEPGRYDPAWVNANTGGFPEGGVVALYQALDHPDCAALHDEILASVATPGSHITETRARFDPLDKVRFHDPNGVWAHAGISDLIASYRNIGPGLMSTVGLYRRLGSPAYSRRDASIAHLVLREVPWLHENGWPENRLEAREAPSLSRRERLVLHGFIEGASPKIIAASMRISPNTLNGYVKSVYRHFGVNSRAQLLARFTRGDGGDR